jgi:lipoprotein-anchoring transpeptidase ErfK/SrfK
MSTATPRIHTAVSCALLVAALAAGVTACGPDGSPLAADPYDAARQISVNAPTERGKKADPDKPLEITAQDTDARITDVVAQDATGRRVAGELAADGSRWHSTSPLAAGAHYTVTVRTEDADGAPGRKVLTFDTSRPTTNKRLNIKLGPKSGTYGVGQPITAELDQPVTDKAQRAIVERGLQVRSTPAVQGSWYWVSDKELHWRPREYWPTGTTVEVRSGLENMRIADRLYGGAAEPVQLTIGDRIVAVTDAAAHQLTFYKNDEKIKQIPVTTGRPGFDTRNGIKVVLAKEGTVRMRSTTIGIAAGSSDSFDLMVNWATRVTWSGEYVHAAPWSVGSQGVANVSHGCTGMSNANAKWFYDNIHEGDIVQVVNSKGKPMETFGNGFGDWNMPWDKWVQGSALTSGGGTSPSDTSRLTPQAL